METLEEFSVILGAMAAGVLAPIIGVIVGGLHPSRARRRTTVTVAAVTWLLWVAQWIVWLFAFTEEIPGEMVPNELFPVSNALMHASTVGCLVLLALLAMSVRQLRTRSVPSDER